MARSLSKPEGEAGRAVSERMNRVNADVTTAVYRRLQLRPSNRVLEIGFGNGKLLTALLACADGLTYVGVDISEIMVTEAIAFNAELVAGQARRRSGWPRRRRSLAPIKVSIRSSRSTSSISGQTRCGR
jgi:SAM-dependent methyltransferase